MIKKITLASIATMALLFIPAQAEGMKCKDKNIACKTKSCDKGMKKSKGGALLMHLPSPMRLLTKRVDDQKLALTGEQKTKLEAQRKEMMPKMMKLKEEIKALQQEIKAACKKNATATEQKANVEKLAILKAQATMTKLTCIEGVKSILNKEQQAYIKELRKAKKATKTMKCASGKCGQGK